MHARRLKPFFYEVADGQRWWTACFAPVGGWSIYNEDMSPILSDGKLGKRILRTCDDLFAADQLAR